MLRRGRKAHHFSLTPAPDCGIAWDADAECWRVDALPARLALTSPVGFREGWFCVEGRLRASGWHRGAWLWLEADETSLRLDLPLTKQGLLKEIVLFPGGVRRLLLQPMSSVGYVRTQNLTIRPVGWLGRMAMMAGRIIAILHGHPWWRLRALGLNVRTILCDITHAYRLAGNLFAEAPPLDYVDWLERHDALTSADLADIKRDLAQRPPGVAFRVVIVAWPGASEGAHGRADAALAAQLLGPTRTDRLPSLAELFATDDAVRDRDDGANGHGASPPQMMKRRCAKPVTPTPALPRKRERGSEAVFHAKVHAGNQAGEVGPSQGDDWVLLLPEGTLLAPHALYWFTRHVERYPQLRFVYCDHDWLDPSGLRHDPVFKPDWSPELLRSTNYIGLAAAIRCDVLARVLGTAASAGAKVGGTHALWLRVTETLRDDQIGHIPALLLSLPDALLRTITEQTSVSAVADHLDRLGIAATVEANGHGDCRVRYAPPEPPPLVSIVVPTRDRLELLRRCLDSVLGQTSYPDFEVLIVDNGSTQAATQAYLEEVATHPQVRVLRDERPFNFSALNNRAVHAARGTYVCLLNNDTEIITPDWLDEMVSRLSQGGVGAVGAKLLYDDGRVQHAGDVIGVGGCANHLHQYLPGDQPGYQRRALLAQDLSAVTGACLLTRRDLYLTLGGLNEKDLPVTFNDVDYCLRLRAAGWRVVWTPYALLYHHESATRGRDVSPTQRARADREAAYMRRQWKHLMLHDPYYNPNLSYNRQDFSLSHAPWIERPWK